MVTNKYSKGFILGKFYPPHLGHLYLIDEADNLCDELIVLVCAKPDESIPGQLRAEWLKKLRPGVKFLFIETNNPDEPTDHPEFWNIWLNTITLSLGGYIPDVLFSSESYGDPLSRLLGIKHHCVDIDRINFPISGTAIRANPNENWKYLPSCVKKYYNKRIVLLGAESVGKTTMAEELSIHFNATYVPEFGREYVERIGNDVNKLTLNDMVIIANNHMKSKESCLAGEKLIFLDTDIVATMIFSEFLFGECPDELLELENSCKADLTLLLTPEVPFIKDGQRLEDSLRWKFHHAYKEKLTELKRPFIEIMGDNYDVRFQQAIFHVKNLEGYQ